MLNQLKYFEYSTVCKISNAIWLLKLCNSRSSAKYYTNGRKTTEMREDKVWAEKIVENERKITNICVDFHFFFFLNRLATHKISVQRKDVNGIQQKV